MSQDIFLNITLLPYRECARRSSCHGHGQADQRTGRGRAAQLMVFATQRRLAEEPMVYVLLPAAAAFLL